MSIVKYLAVIILQIVILQSFAQVTTISFNQKSYAGDSIYVITKADFISNTPDTIYRGRVGNEGKFECSLYIKNTIYIYVPLEFFKLTFYIEPGKVYDLHLPLRKKLSISDELNPYFEPTEIIPGIENSDSTELNSLISQFDDEYNAFLAKSFIKTYYTAKRAFADSAAVSYERSVDGSAIDHGRRQKSRSCVDRIVG